MSYVLTARWTEPCDGNAVWVCDITEDDAKTIQATIDWLKEHAGQEYGHTLCEWELLPSKAKNGDLVGLIRVMAEIRLNSRYDEIDGKPGDFYGGPCPHFS